MASLLMVGFAILLLVGVCLQLAAAWRYLRLRGFEQDDMIFEKDVEWQLQHELEDAIEASSKASTPLIDQHDEKKPLLSFHPQPSPHVHFLDDIEIRPIPNRGDLNLDWRLHPTNITDGLGFSQTAQRTRPSYWNPAMRDASNLRHETESRENFLEPVPEQDPHFLVNAKQYHRILKRRMARHTLDEYFKNRKTMTRQQRKTTKAIND